MHLFHFVKQIKVVQISE